MPRRSVIQEEESTEINLSPMIDCIFILLIFFIVTTVFVEEKGLQVNKPDAAAVTSPEESLNVVLEITSDNKVKIDGAEISFAEISGRLKAVVDPETPVTIRAHEKSDHGTFVAVWDAARGGGAEMLSFSTVQ